jgi:hypothetical protein
VGCCWRWLRPTGGRWLDKLIMAVAVTGMSVSFLIVIIASRSC